MSGPSDSSKSSDQNGRGTNEPLTEATAKWLAALPVEVRPVNLARDFPRVANKLCELWKRPAQCEPFLVELMFDQRGGRQGFPLSVAGELAALNSHYATIYPRTRSIWDTQWLT
jgi:hypothetical protein